MATAQQEQKAQGAEHGARRSGRVREPAQAEFQAANGARGKRGRERGADARHPGARGLDRRQGRGARYDRGDDRPPRREADGADERSAACARIPATGERLARALLSRFQLRDRRDAQNPRPERRQERSFIATSRTIPGARWDQSPLFKAVYESEFGTLGGEPYGALVADYCVQPLRRPTCSLLRDLSKIASASLAPLITERRPQSAGHGFVARADESARHRQS